MSEEEQQLTGKAKKAKRSEERSKKNQKKAKKAEATAEEDVATEITAPVEEPEKKKKSKKRSRDEVDDADGDEKPRDGTTSAQKDSAPKLHKKHKKDNPNLIKTDGEQTEPAPSGKHRFIVFIGNLPFSATTETITKHFASVSPTSVRHITDAKTKKSKGFAFLEFDNYDKMKTCLKLYHHSTFDSGFEKEKKRKINVELTAGGGGKSEQRKEKLKTKNEKLTEERQRRAETEAKQENRKLKKSAKGKQGEREPVAVPDEVPEPQPAAGMEGMNPARMAMINRGR
ncbi:hypothetical protein MBLNU457_4153t1 [Dothideomycetes sp. NU457]